MNLIIWLISTSFLGLLVGTIFDSAGDGIILNMLVSILGVVLGGLFSVNNIQETPVIDLDVKSFSPGAFLLIIFCSVIILVIAHLLFGKFGTPAVTTSLPPNF